MVHRYNPFTISKSPCYLCNLFTFPACDNATALAHENDVVDGTNKNVRVTTQSF